MGCRIVENPANIATGRYTCLFKTPHRPNTPPHTLIVVVLVAIVEVLFPCVICTVLRRTPVVVVGKTANSTFAKMLTCTQSAFDAFSFTAPRSSSFTDRLTVSLPLLNEALLASDSLDHRNSGTFHRPGISPSGDLFTNPVHERSNFGLLFHGQNFQVNT